MALRGLVSCPNLEKMDWERKREGKREKTEERRKCGVVRERSSTFRRGKEKSCSPRQGLHVGTRVGEFDKIRKGRGFSPTCFTFCLRVM